eukprot:GFUD01001604.1.p1 GENE.GFUD01001604.1~~GFUD01001604.1.p1  ORF type:complete len:546 (+),score=139.71 GFUD01001604.1:509-2146(+)
MLVQTCPATTNTLGSYSGAASYCGMAVSAQNDSNYAVTNNVINDRVSIPIVVENTSVLSDKNGNRQVIEYNKHGNNPQIQPDETVNNSEIFDDNSKTNFDPENEFLKVDTDTIETESHMLNIETTITETFLINSNEIVDDIIRELIEVQPNENSSDKNSVSNHSLNESEIVDQLSIHTVENIDKSAVTYDLYSENFERAFQLESSANLPISSVSPSPSSDSSLCQKLLRSREPSPRLNENKREFERDADSRSSASLERMRDPDRASSDSDEVQKKSCLDKSAKSKEICSSLDGEKSSGHRVTFNDKNEVASQDKDGTFKVTYRQLGEKIKNHAESVEPKKAALKVQYGEKSRLESVPIAPKILNFNDSTFDTDMYQIQDSCDSSTPPEEWDNPFQPEGEVSQDADLILQLWKGGKLNEENLEENLKNLAAAASAESSTCSSPEHSNQQGLQNFNMENGVNNAIDREREQKNVVNGIKGENPVNGVNSANGLHYVASSKPGSPKKNQTNQIPVTNNMKDNTDMTYTVVLSEKQKHKNKIKKHCNMM